MWVHLDPLYLLAFNISISGYLRIYSLFKFLIFRVIKKSQAEMDKVIENTRYIDMAELVPILMVLILSVIYQSNLYEN